MEWGGRTMAGECEEMELAVIGKRQNRVWFDGRIQQPLTSQFVEAPASTA